MNIIIEQEFIKKYIDKGYQERLLLELSSAKRRTKALSRFSHNAEDVLNKNIFKKTITNKNGRPLVAHRCFSVIRCF